MKYSNECSNLQPMFLLTRNILEALSLMTIALMNHCQTYIFQSKGNKEGYMDKIELLQQRKGQQLTNL